MNRTAALAAVLILTATVVDAQSTTPAGASDAAVNMNLKGALEPRPAGLRR